jgi:hypothetical protein
MSRRKRICLLLRTPSQIEDFTAEIHRCAALIRAEDIEGLQRTAPFFLQPILQQIIQSEQEAAAPLEDPQLEADRLMILKICTKSRAIMYKTVIDLADHFHQKTTGKTVHPLVRVVERFSIQVAECTRRVTLASTQRQVRAMRRQQIGIEWDDAFRLQEQRNVRIGELEAENTKLKEELNQLRAILEKRQSAQKLYGTRHIAEATGLTPAGVIIHLDKLAARGKIAGGNNVGPTARKKHQKWRLTHEEYELVLSDIDQFGHKNRSKK